MAVLTYGGIVLQVLKTHHIGSEDVYDETGLDYLWTKYTFDVTGLVNLANTSYTTQPNNPAPVATPGQPPFLTVANIRDTLSLPRQQLTYTDEVGNEMVRSPADAPVPAAQFQPGGGIQNNIVQPPVPLDCDCDGGPKPLRPAEVLAVHGAGKSVIVRFTVSTTVNDSIFWTGQGGLTVLGRAAPKPPVILSNRWSLTESLDEAAFSTRIYSGRAVFRADLLRDLTITPDDGAGKRLAVPDDFRSYWASFNIPPGFQRQQVFVEQEPSGFAVRYRVVDVQLPVTLTDRRAYKLEVLQTTGMETVGTEQQLEKFVATMAEGAISDAASLNFDPFHDAGVALAASLRFAKASLDLNLSNIPRSTDAYVITATGQPGSRRLDLAGLCYKVLANFIGFADNFWSSQSARLTLDIMGKWAQLVVTVERGPFRSAVVTGNAHGGAAIDVRGRIPADDGMNGITSTTPGTQPPFPSDSGVRGTALEWLVAQTLMTPYLEAPQAAGHSLAGQGLLPP